MILNRCRFLARISSLTLPIKLRKPNNWRIKISLKPLNFQNNNSLNNKVIFCLKILRKPQAILCLEIKKIQSKLQPILFLEIKKILGRLQPILCLEIKKRLGRLQPILCLEIKKIQSKLKPILCLDQFYSFAKGSHNQASKINFKIQIMINFLRIFEAHDD